MSKFHTHYTNLKINEDATIEVINGAYKYLIQKWHPDKNPDQRQEAERNTRIINEAYAVLSNPVSRKEYDEFLRKKREEITDSVTKEVTDEIEKYAAQREAKGAVWGAVITGLITAVAIILRGGQGQ